MKGLQIEKNRHARYYLAAFVSLITFLAYLPALRNGFVEWDDPEYVLENPHIYTFTAAFFRWAFSSFYATNWHPLTWMSHALDYALWGLDPMGHHLTNNLLHAANSFLVVLLAIRLMAAWKANANNNVRSSFPDERAMLIAGGVTGLLFGLHPVHVESVAWVAERKDLLCGLFFLVSIMVYLSYVSQRTFRTYFLSLCVFALALLSKPMAVTLPLVLLILDWFPFGRIHSLKSFRSAVVEKIPFIALSLASSTLTVLAQREAIHSFEVIPLSSRLCVAAGSIVAYLVKMAWPLNLVPFYPYPKEVSFFSLKYLSAMIIVAGITAICIAFVKKRGLFLAGWGCYVITLVPVLGIVQVGEQAMADRYTYLPSLGPFLIAGLGAAWVLTRTHTAQRGAILNRVAAAAAVFAFISLIWLTVDQIVIWKNSITLLTAVIDKEPELPFAYNNRGNAYRSKGQLEKAMQDFDRAVSLDPSYYRAYNNRGAVYSEMGRLDKAMEDIDRSLALNPRSDISYNNKGMVYGKTGSFDKAIEQFNKAIEMNPDYPGAYSNRGLAYSLIGEHDRALRDLNRALELDARYAAAYGNRGDLYLKTGKRELALSDLQKACGLGDRGACRALKKLVNTGAL